MEVCINQTPNYQLNQWDKSDRIMMEDFNTDNAKIEAALSETMALAQKAPFAVGKLESYDGSKAITVDLGRQPQMVIVGNKNGFTNIITGQSSFAYPGHAVAMPGMPGLKSSYSTAGTNTTILEVTETGFTLKAGFSSDMKPYYYLALF